ncbi:MAG: hypothetical protein ACI9JT_000355 [Polaribacter sp.]|jgi:hypothetical protein
MKKVLKYFIILLATFLTIHIFSQNKTIIKKALTDGTYFYSENKGKILVKIKGTNYTEYHPNNEFIKANIEWISNRVYKLVITEIKKSNLPFKKGTQLITKITRIKEDNYYYKASLGQQAWTGKLVKVSGF